MNKKIIALFLVFSLLFMAAECSTSQKKTTTGTFIGGTQGILINFKETAPVPEFQQKDSVPVTVILQNKGEYDLDAGIAKVKLFGVNLDNFGLSSAKTYKTSGTLKKVSAVNPDGSEQEVSFGNLVYNLDLPGNEIIYSLKAKVCYPYQTQSFVTVCMRSKLLEKTDTEVCSLDKEKIVAGDISSAPVQITSIMEETRGSDQVKFSIKIENKGGGEVYSTKTTCDIIDQDFIKKLDNQNKVTYEIVNPTDVKCGSSESNKGEINLASNVYTLTCWETVNDVHEDKLNIKLTYLYVSNANKDIKIYKTL